MTLQERLRECFQPVEDVFPQSDGSMLGLEAAAALDAKDERIRELEGALRGLMPYWTHAWDLVDGGLFIDERSVKKFDASFQRAHAAIAGEKP